MFVNKNEKMSGPLGGIFFDSHCIHTYIYLIYSSLLR